MCLGVYGRGLGDELQQNHNGDWIPAQGRNLTSTNTNMLDLPPLSQFIEHPIVTTQCTNDGAVVEWVFVPFVAPDEAVIVNAKDGGEEEARSEL